MQNRIPASRLGPVFRAPLVCAGNVVVRSRLDRSDLKCRLAPLFSLGGDHGIGGGHVVVPPDPEYTRRVVFPTTGTRRKNPVDLTDPRGPRFPANAHQQPDDPRITTPPAKYYMQPGLTSAIEQMLAKTRLPAVK